MVALCVFGKGRNRMGGISALANMGTLEALLTERPVHGAQQYQAITVQVDTSSEDQKYKGMNDYTKQKIVEQAQQDAKDGKYLSSTAREMQKEYVSERSSWRAGLYSKVMGFLQSSGLGSGFGKTYSNIVVRDTSGHLVAIYDSQLGGWDSVMTPTEAKETKDFNSTYMKAYKDYKDSLSNPGSTVSTGSTESGTVLNTTA